MKKTLVIAVIMLLVGGAGGFFGGMKYQQSKSPAFFSRGQFSENFQQGTIGINGSLRGGAAGGGFASGEIISQDDSSITLKLPNNGGSKIVFFTDSTQISKMASGEKSDLAAGTSVVASGTANSDGSINAQSISIRGQDVGQPPPVSP